MCSRMAADEDEDQEGVSHQPDGQDTPTHRRLGPLAAAAAGGHQHDTATEENRTDKMKQPARKCAACGENRKIVIRRNASSFCRSCVIVFRRGLQLTRQHQEEEKARRREQEQSKSSDITNLQPEVVIDVVGNQEEVLEEPNTSIVPRLEVVPTKEGVLEGPEVNPMPRLRAILTRSTTLSTTPPPPPQLPPYTVPALPPMPPPCHWPPTPTPHQIDTQTTEF